MQMPLNAFPYKKHMLNFQYKQEQNKSLETKNYFECQITEI